MVEVGGNSQPHDSPFAEAATKMASRAANLGQTAALMAYLRSYLQDKKAPKAEDGGGRTDWQRVMRDLPYVQRHLWGGRNPDGTRRPGLNLDETYQAWMRAADHAGQDPRGARVWMELCRRRMAACPGGPELLRVYHDNLYNGLGNVEAMRRAWKQTEAARQYAGRDDKPHRAKVPLGSRDPGGRDLPVPADGRVAGQPDGARGPARPSPSAAAAEAAQLLGSPEVVLPELRRFQDRYGNAADRDGANLARQWLADVQRQGRITPQQHDAWREQVTEIRRSPEHARWRVATGLAEEQPQVPTAAGEPAPQHADQPSPGSAATAEHLAGHADQHRRVSERKMGRAVDDPTTPDVDEQNLHRQRANTERGPAEMYDNLAATHDGLRHRAAAARPAPGTIGRAARPADLTGKRSVPVVAVQPNQARPPTPGRG